MGNLNLEIILPTFSLEICPPYFSVQNRIWILSPSKISSSIGTVKHRCWFNSEGFWNHIFSYLWKYLNVFSTTENKVTHVLEKLLSILLNEISADNDTLSNRKMQHIFAAVNVIFMSYHLVLSLVILFYSKACFAAQFIVHQYIFGMLCGLFQQLRDL